MNHTALVAGLAVVAGLGCVWLWGSGVRAGKQAERSLKQLGRTGAVLGWGVVCSVLIVAVQWAVITKTHDSGVLAMVLAVPGVFAGMSLARYCAVTLGTTGIESRYLRGQGGGRGGRGGRR